jgi:Ubiquitin carboxyl-terminal hydrolase
VTALVFGKVRAFRSMKVIGIVFDSVAVFDPLPKLPEELDVHVQAKVIYLGSKHKVRFKRLVEVKVNHACCEIFLKTDDAKYELKGMKSSTDDWNRFQEKLQESCKNIVNEGYTGNSRGSTTHSDKTAPRRARQERKTCRGVPVKSTRKSGAFPFEKYWSDDDDTASNGTGDVRSKSTGKSAGQLADSSKQLETKAAAPNNAPRRTQYERVDGRAKASKIKRTAWKVDDDTDDDRMFESDSSQSENASSDRLVSPDGTDIDVEIRDSSDNDPSTETNVVNGAANLTRDTFFQPRRSRESSASVAPSQASVNQTPPQRPRHLPQKSSATLHVHSEEPTWFTSMMSAKVPRKVAHLGHFAHSRSTVEEPEQRHAVENDDPIEDIVDTPPQTETFPRKRPACETFFQRKRISPLPLDLTVNPRGHHHFPSSDSLHLPLRNSFQGLRNLGNTCYLNASLQMLFTCRKQFVSLRKWRGAGLTQSLCWIDRELDRKGTARPLQQISPSRVKDAIDAKTDKFAGSEQRDAHEFLSDLVDYVHEELETESTNGEATPSHGSQTSPHIPTDDFCMTLLVSLKCCSCGYSRYVCLEHPSTGPSCTRDGNVY